MADDIEITAAMLADESFDLEGAVRAMLAAELRNDPAFREAARRDDEEWEQIVLCGDPEECAPPTGLIHAKGSAR